MHARDTRHDSEAQTVVHLAQRARRICAEEAVEEVRQGVSSFSVQ